MAERGRGAVGQREVLLVGGDEVIVDGVGFEKCRGCIRVLDRCEREGVLSEVLAGELCAAIDLRPQDDLGRCLIVG